MKTALSLSRYIQLAAQRCAELEWTRAYYRIPMPGVDTGIETAKAQRAYDRAQHHVARLTIMSSGETPATFTPPPPIMNFNAMFASANAYLQLEAWRANGKTGQRTTWKAAPAPTGDLPITRQHNPIALCWRG